VPLQVDQLLALDEQPVTVITHLGRVISIGRLSLAKNMENGGHPRVELTFETEQLRCTMGVPAARLEELVASLEGGHYRYRLPAGEQLWFSPGDPPSPLQPGSAAIVETFALPVVQPLPVAVRPLRKISVTGLPPPPR
jgi:hypothetical protein